MKNLQLFAIFTLLSGLTFVSCTKDDTEITSKNGLIPLKTGNSWSYQLYRSNTLTDTVTLTVEEYISISGNNGFKLTSGENPFHETFVVDNDKDGNFVSVGGYSDNDTLIASSIMYKKDAMKGDSWDYHEISYTESGSLEKFDIQMFCVSADTMITTPAGDFKCKAYKWTPDAGADVFFDYLSENTGLIKSEHFENNHLASYQVLFDYNVGK